MWHGATRQPCTGAAGNQKVIIGPWTHSGQASTIQGELTYPENSDVYNQEVNNAVDWFDRARDVGLPDLLEQLIRSNPRDEDTDGDDLVDLDEFNPESAFSVDLSTYREFLRRCADAGRCTFAPVEGAFGTSVVRKDTDGDDIPIPMKYKYRYRCR